jgi:hypothetical protein
LTSGYRKEFSRQRNEEMDSPAFRAIFAMSEPQVVIPSLRTHKPNPAERDPMGPCRRSAFENSSLAARNNRMIVIECPKSQTFGRSLDQKDRESSVNEPAHADIHRHAERQERKQHRRSTVTH